jgi:hypothetical protein
VPWQRAKTLIVRDRRTTPAQHFFCACLKQPSTKQATKNLHQTLCLPEKNLFYANAAFHTLHAGARSELSGEVSFHHTNLIPGANNYSAQRREVPPAATVHNTQISEFTYLYQIDYIPVKQNLAKFPKFLAAPGRTNHKP